MEDLKSMHGLALFAVAVAGLAVAHRAVLRLPTGLPRLIFILPLLPIFFMLPWTIPIYHLRAILSFIFLWTVPSKLLLLCWDAGIDYPSSGFLYFATIVMLPIRVRGKKAKRQGPDTTHKGQFWWQFIAVIIILNIYSYRKGLPVWAIYVLYACHIYLGLELMLGGLAKLATACFGVESDPQFNNPFMSASLSEFWGRRWNLVVTTILRSTVYNPALLLLMRAEKQNAHVLQTPTSMSLGASDSCVQKASPHPQGQANHITTLDPQGKNSDNLIATRMDNSHAAESKKTNTGFAKRESTEPGLRNGNEIPSSRNVIDTCAMEASKANGHINHHSLSSDSQLEPDIDTEPSHGLHPVTSSEDSTPEAEDGIKGTQKPSAAVAAEITICQHNNTIPDINSEHCALNSDAPCNPKPNPNSSPYDANSEPIFEIGHNSPVRNNASIPSQSVENPNLVKSCALLSNGDLAPNPNPEIYMKTAKNGMGGSTEKPSLRTRAAAMLRARAGAMLSNSINPNPMNPSACDSQPNRNPSQNLCLATSESREAQKSTINVGAKPSLRARAVAMLVTFVVSGLVHELIFYYINKSRATGEVTAFFILHGCATALEVLLKKTMLAQVRLPRPLSIALTLAFLYATAAWLFMPPLTRYNADINTIAEYQRFQSAVISFFTNRSHTGR